MKNIFVIGLQRTGTNYVERLLNDSVEGIDFRGYVRDGGQNYSKHEFPYIKEAVTNSIIKQDGFIVVVKNPYMWVESICFRDVYSFLNSKAYGDHTGTYKLKEETEIKVGDKRYNIFNILKLYKEYYQEWSKHKDVLFIQYESFLEENEALVECDKVINYMGDGRVKSNFKLPSKPVKNSPNFTQKDFDYYKSQIPKKLTEEHISIINSVLGKDFIKKLGYRIL